jgi:hypothetical protein
MSDETRIPHPQAIPNHQQAVIPRDKLEGYALNPDHDPGKHKARVFKSALGFEQNDWEALSQRILAALPFHAATFKGNAPYGERYEVVLPIAGLNGQTKEVLTAWIVETGSDFPKLVTTYVEKE